jgi:hypothetical protein
MSAIAASPHPKATEELASVTVDGGDVDTVLDRRGDVRQWLSSGTPRGHS